MCWRCRTGTRHRRRRRRAAAAAVRVDEDVKVLRDNHAQLAACSDVRLDSEFLNLADLVDRILDNTADVSNAELADAGGKATDIRLYVALFNAVTYPVSLRAHAHKMRVARECQRLHVAMLA